MEDDLEAGLGIVSGLGSLPGKFAVRFGQETADVVRPLFHNATGNQENPENVFRFSLGIKPVKGEKKSKRPPKPPRPPQGPALDAYDLKLIRELSALALERRLRNERIKDLKKKRVSKAASSSNSGFLSLIFTVLFCFIILFQGVCSRSCSAMKLQTSSAPVLSPSGSGEEQLSVQVFENFVPTDFDKSASQRYFTSVLNQGSTRYAG